MPVRKSRIKSCIILNPPATPEEQDEYNKRFANALAIGLYRSLSSEELDMIIQSLKKELSESESSDSKMVKLVGA